MKLFTLPTSRNVKNGFEQLKADVDAKQRINLTIKRNAKSYLKIQIYVYILVLWVVFKRRKKILKNGENEMQYK